MITDLRDVLASEGLIEKQALGHVWKLEFDSRVKEGDKTIYEVLTAKPRFTGKGEMYKVKESHPRHGDRVVNMSDRSWGDLVDQALELQKYGEAKVYTGRMASPQRVVERFLQSSQVRVNWLKRGNQWTADLQVGTYIYNPGNKLLSLRPTGLKIQGVATDIASLDEATAAVVNHQERNRELFNSGWPTRH